MTEPFTKDELEHLMMALNIGIPEPGCATCVSVRQKVEKMISEYPAQPTKTQVEIGGHTVTRERL